MKIYFLSSQKCVLTVNGAYFGIVDDFERFAEISLKDGLLLTFTPENAQPVSFFLTEDVRFHPPAGCEVYLLPRALALYVRDFPPVNAPMRLIAQERFENALVTVFFQCGVECSVQTPERYFVSTLPPSFRQCALDRQGEFYLFRSPDMLAVYHENGTRLLLERATEFSINGNELSAVLPLSDCLGRSAECVWELSETQAIRTGFTLRQARTRQGETDGEKIAAELLPFAFFESLLIGANPDDFLSDGLLPEKEKLRSFLGNFKGVTPTSDPNVCGLVYEKDERLFEVKYFTVETENGRVADIKG